MPLIDDMGADGRWFAEDLDESSRASKITEIAGRLWRDQSGAREEMVTAARLYGNTALLGLGPRAYRQKITSTRNRRIAMNLIKSVVDTYRSLIIKDQPKITFATQGGDDAIQRKAKLLTKAVDGVFYAAKLRTKSLQVVRDSALFPFGVVKMFENWDDEDHPQVSIERKKPWLILVDYQDAADGDPQCLMEVMFVDRRALMEAYPDKSADILSAGGSEFNEADVSDSENDDQITLVAVVEAWRKAPNSKTPGRRSMSIGNVLLEDEEYKRNVFPHKFLYKDRPLQGIHGDSFALELAPTQVEIASMLVNFQRSRKLAVGHWLVEENSRVNTNAINDVLASKITYAGVKPEFVVYQHASPDDYAHLDRLWNRGFESVGISAQTAASQKPAGLNSGKAQLVYADVQSQRFKPCYEEFQGWHVELAEEAIYLLRSISKKKPDFTIRAMGKSMMDAVKWGDANLEDEEFVVHLMPTNALADDPAAQMQDVQDKINAGMISPFNGARLLGLPDNEEYQSLAQASYDLVQTSATRIIESGEFFPPEDYMDLDGPDGGIAVMQMLYNKARLNAVPEDRLSLMRTWMDQANSLSDEKKAKLAQPPAPATETGAAPAPPGAPPPGASPPGAPAAVPGMPGGVAGRVHEIVGQHLARETAGNMI